MVLLGRFWKQGYWKNHLAGRKYHISALYVIDLVKFRQIAAGNVFSKKNFTSSIQSLARYNFQATGYVVNIKH